MSFICHNEIINSVVLIIRIENTTFVYMIDNLINKVSLGQAKQRFEREYIKRTLIYNNWNKQKTAKILGVQRSHLYNMLSVYKIEKSEIAQSYFLDENFEVTPIVLPCAKITKEKWLPVSWANNYFISNHGRVRKNKKFINISCTSYAYPVVSITLNGFTKAIKVASLVAEAFIPNPDNKPMINHIDCNKKNSHVSNLEWVTASENVIHSIKFRKEEYPNSAS